MSTQMRLTRIRRAALRAAVAVAVVGATAVTGLLGTAAPAHANGETDFVLIDTGLIDLGLMSDPWTGEFLAPGASVRWQANNVAHTYQPYLFGVMSLKNVANGSCGGIKIQAYDYYGGSLGVAATPFICPYTNTRRYFPAEPALGLLSQSTVHRVRVSALILFPGDTSAVVQSSRDVYPYD